MAMLILTTLLILIFIAGVIFGAFMIDSGNDALGAVLLVICILGVCVSPILYGGLKVVGPNEALVLTLFGKYYGTIMESGFYFVNPFTSYNNPAYTSALAKAAGKAAELGGEGLKGSEQPTFFQVLPSGKFSAIANMSQSNTKSISKGKLLGQP